LRSNNLLDFFVGHFSLLSLFGLCA
jgi:hypothetical protein